MQSTTVSWHHCAIAHSAWNMCFEVHLTELLLRLITYLNSRQFVQQLSHTERHQQSIQFSSYFACPYTNVTNLQLNYLGNLLLFTLYATVCHAVSKIHKCKYIISTPVGAPRLNFADRKAESSDLLPWRKASTAQLSSACIKASGKLMNTNCGLTIQWSLPLVYVHWLCEYPHLLAWSGTYHWTIHPKPDLAQWSQTFSHCGKQVLWCNTTKNQYRYTFWPSVVHNELLQWWGYCCFVQMNIELGVIMSSYYTTVYDHAIQIK